MRSASGDESDESDESEKSEKKAAASREAIWARERDMETHVRLARTSGLGRRKEEDEDEEEARNT